MEIPSGPVAPFDDESGVWLRCAFHVHTTESDGMLSPPMQRRAHVMAGYDVLAITDHDRCTSEPAGDDHLLVIGGTEISLTAPKSGGPLHLLGLGITGMPEVGRDASLPEAAAAVRAAGGLPFVAHPVWSGLRTDEIDFAGVAGIEIFNAGCEVEQDRAHASAHWDVWLSMGHRLTAIATDDTHYPGFDAFRAWTMVHARDRTRAALLVALTAGRFYASSGPRITGLTFDEGVLTVQRTPARAIAALATPPYGGRVNAGHDALAHRGERLPSADGQTREGIIDGDLLTGARFSMQPGMRYVRIVVLDAHGRRAWSNPVWLV
ncbi:MAG: CehA/McbA family metallohydrolase [Thermomicrobiales bacterium]